MSIQAAWISPYWILDHEERKMQGICTSPNESHMLQAYVSYQCYDLFGFSGTGGSVGVGDGALLLSFCGIFNSLPDALTVRAVFLV